MRISDNYPEGVTTADIDEWWGESDERDPDEYDEDAADLMELEKGESSDRR